ncbi:MAG: GIY-YIG nuclease family protein [Patescibacteria group bacterium]
MFYTYVLRSEKDKKLYIGFSTDLRKRFGEHVSGLVPATRCRLPAKLIFYEAYLNKYDALRRERYFKTDKGKKTLEVMLAEYFRRI